MTVGQLHKCKCLSPKTVPYTNRWNLKYEYIFHSHKNSTMVVKILAIRSNKKSHTYILGDFCVFLLSSWVIATHCSLGVTLTPLIINHSYIIITDFLIGRKSDFTTSQNFSYVITLNHKQCNLNNVALTWVVLPTRCYMKVFSGSECGFQEQVVVVIRA